jgi:VCBS repeat protein
VPTGQLAFWLLDGTTVIGYVIPNAPEPGADWVIVGTGDSNRDGDLDLFWQQQSTGALAVWHMHGTEFEAGLNLSASPGTNWQVVAVADLDGDGLPDLVLQETNGGNMFTLPQVAAWYFADTTLRFGAMLSPSAANAPWRVVGPR